MKLIEDDFTKHTYYKDALMGKYVYWNELRKQTQHPKESSVLNSILLTIGAVFGVLFPVWGGDVILPLIVIFSFIIGVFVHVFIELLQSYKTAKGVYWIIPITFLLMVIYIINTASNFDVLYFQKMLSSFDKGDYEVLLVEVSRIVVFTFFSLSVLFLLYYRWEIVKLMSDEELELDSKNLNKVIGAAYYERSKNKEDVNATFFVHHFERHEDYKNWGMDFPKRIRVNPLDIVSFEIVSAKNYMSSKLSFHIDLGKTNLILLQTRDGKTHLIATFFMLFSDFESGILNQLNNLFIVNRENHLHDFGCLSGTNKLPSLELGMKGDLDTISKYDF